MIESNLEENVNYGYISGINGSLIEVKGIENKVKLHDLIKIVNENILCEVIQIYPDFIIAQCYENTSRLSLYSKVINLQESLSMELAPGLLSNVFDGIQRPLKEIYNYFDGEGLLKRGIELPALSRTKKWHFTPIRNEGDVLCEGDIVGIVEETSLIEHKIMIPPGISGKLSIIVEEGYYTIIDEIYHLKKDGIMKSFNMLQKWSITKKRPYKNRFLPNKPLLTGLRVIDLLFPIAIGGSVAVPGGFGTGKTIIQQSLAKWSNADIIIFIGCGERGNEIADVLNQFAKITDPKRNRPILERTIIIANTSNMPVFAREASIFSGVTIAEYYRDMGYNVAVLADSTSRWAESVREISALLEEMPAEEGFPSYLPSRLSSFYERAGVFNLLGSDSSNNPRKGALTIVGSVSPPSGDFSEPITSTTKRLVQAFWVLDANLAYSKHYPAINWLESYSNYPEYISDWWLKRDILWPELEANWLYCRQIFNKILSKENDLKDLMQLIGEENLPEDDQLTMLIARLIHEGFLIQSSFSEIDNYTDYNKLLGMVKIIILLFLKAKTLLKEGIIMEDIRNLDIIDEIRRISHQIPNNQFFLIEELKDKLLLEINYLKSMYGGL